LFCCTEFLPDCRLESRRVNGCSTHTNVFGEGWLLLLLRLESRRVYSCSTYTNVFGEG
jgi:hypothetical protein